MTLCTREHTGQLTGIFNKKPLSYISALYLLNSLLSCSSIFARWEDILPYRLFGDKFANTLSPQSRCARRPLAEGLSSSPLSETLHLGPKFCHLRSAPSPCSCPCGENKKAPCETLSRLLL